MRYLKTIIILFAVVSAISCKSEYEQVLTGMDPEAKYKMAMNLYEGKKYSKAASLFESLANFSRGTERDDTVRFYLAMSNYNAKDYYTAEANFNTFVEYFPLSPFSAKANFLRIDCLYRSTYRYELDQVPTHNCLAAIKEYRRDFPQSEYLDLCDKMDEDLNQRLDTKAFEAAHLYYHMEDYLAALTAFGNVLKDNSENMYREQILYYLAKSHFKYADNSIKAKKQERFLSFVDAYFNYIEEYPADSKYHRELDLLYKRAQKVLGRDVTASDKLLERQSRHIEKQTTRDTDYNVEKQKVRLIKKRRKAVSAE